MRSLNLKRQGRSSLLWAVLFLVLSQVSLRLLIDGPFSHWRDPTFEIKYRRLQRVLNEIPEPRSLVVMTGSSITSNAFQARHIEETLSKDAGHPVVCFNMAAHGSSFLSQSLFIRRLVQRGVKPSHVVLELTPRFMHGPEMPDMGRFPTFHLNDGDLETIRQYHEPPNVERDVWIKQLCPVYAHRLAMLNVLARQLVPVVDRMPTWGAGLDERCWSELKAIKDEERRHHEDFVARAYESNLSGFEPGALAFRVLDDLLAFTKREQIATTLVVIPQGPTLRERYNQERLASCLDRIQASCRSHGARIVNAHDWLAAEQFTDSVHPNTSGAETFSSRLAAEVLSPVVAAKALPAPAGLPTAAPR